MLVFINFVDIHIVWVLKWSLPCPFVVSFTIDTPIFIASGARVSFTSLHVYFIIVSLLDSLVGL